MSKKRGAVLVDFALGAVEPEALAGQELEQRGGTRVESQRQGLHEGQAGT